MKAKERAIERYRVEPCKPLNIDTQNKFYAYIEGYRQAEKDMLSEYGWLVPKVKVLKLKYCHNREAVKAIEEACDILNEFRQ